VVGSVVRDERQLAQAGLAIAPRYRGEEVGILVESQLPQHLQVGGNKPQLSAKAVESTPARHAKRGNRTVATPTPTTPTIRAAVRP
jgi:hypothetical protein